MFDLVDAGIQFVDFFWMILKIWRLIFIRSYRNHILKVWEKNEPMQRSIIVLGITFSIIFNLIIEVGIFWFIIF